MNREDSLDWLIAAANYGARIWAAIQRLEAEEGSAVTLAEVARRVSSYLPKNVDPATVSRWRHQKQEPSYAETVALAWTLNTDPGWLAFGDQSVAADAWFSMPNPHEIRAEREAMLRSGRAAKRDPAEFERADAAALAEAEKAARRVLDEAMRRRREG